MVADVAWLKMVDYSGATMTGLAMRSVISPCDCISCCEVRSEKSGSCALRWSLIRMVTDHEVMVKMVLSGVVKIALVVKMVVG